MVQKSYCISERAAGVFIKGTFLMKQQQDTLVLERFIPCWVFSLKSYLSAYNIALILFFFLFRLIFRFVTEHEDPAGTTSH